MRILIITNLYPPHILGGYEILCDQVVRELVTLGHEVRVLTSNHGVGGGVSPTEDPCPVYRNLSLYLPFSSPGGLSRRSRYRTTLANRAVAAGHIASFSPDIAFVWSQLRFSLGAAQAAQRAGVPTLFTLNDDHLAGYLPVRWSLSPRRMLGALLDRTLLRQATLSSVSLKNCMAISAKVRQNLVDKGVDVGHARVIHQGIPVEKFPVKATPGEIHDPVRLLYAGQLHEYKGVHTLLEAAARLDLGRPFEISIAGEGPELYKARLRQLAASASLRVRWLGRLPQAQLAEVYRESDILVFPSIWDEPFGLTHLEAMASGTPVISTANGGQGEFLVHGENALVFQKENPRELADCIAAMVADQPLRCRLASAGRQCVETRFTIPRFTRDIAAFLHESLTPGRP